MAVLFLTFDANHPPQGRFINPVALHLPIPDAEGQELTCDTMVDISIVELQWIWSQKQDALMAALALMIKLI